MGGCVSISVPCDQTLSHVGRCLTQKASYIRKLQENVQTLQTATQELKDLREDLLTRVSLEEEKGQRRLATVQRWLSNVETIESQVDELLASGTTTEVSRSFRSRFDYGKKVFKQIKEVNSLKSRADFKVMAERVPRSKVEERLIYPVVGMKAMTEKVRSRLMEDGVGTLGLYGMGGVGKTTLLSQINNTFVNTGNDFDVVIWVVVSKDQKIESVQETISRRLGLFSEEWKHIKEEEKASEIKKMLKGKRYMLLLDDIWSKVDIQRIGFPTPTRMNRCKVVFTTRSKEVCSEMRVDVEMEVKCLASDEAWELFRMRVGDLTLESHQNIPQVARMIAEKCYGLPLALNVIGETMSSRKTIQEWSHAQDVLTSFAADFSCMQDKILPILKFSYDNLKDEMFRKCLQYCALFPEDYEIEKEELVEYWICEGTTDGSKDRDKAKNHGYEVIGTLVRACLWMEYEHAEFLKMHDMVREMALWITADLGKKKESFIVRTGSGLSHVPVVEDWSVVRKMSLMGNEIEKIDACPYYGTKKLGTLFLQNNKLVSISERFFQWMTELKVLDLSSNESLTELPADISKLVALQYLNLSSTGIEVLPFGIKSLTKLIHLNLEFTHNLKSVVGISNLLSLQVLMLFESNISLNDGLVEEELKSLEHLKLLTLTLKDAFVMERLLNIHSLVNFARHLSLDKCIPNAVRISLVAGSSAAPSCHDELQHMTSPNTMYFRSLTRVDIVNCEGLRDLTWLMYAPSLTNLHVEMSFQTEEIISREKVMKIGGEKFTTPFLKLESLSLVFLYAMKSIYWSPLPFPALKYLKIHRCPDLRKLPLDSASAKGRDLVLYAYKEWLRDVEWEDEATKNRFCPT
ncbi:Disease resistance protein (NBS-LRR class) family [Raphanus sativus]|uniref:Probable disease resistance protein At5g63020 n=1 Tax=Raphanus sativus TaxID=3726 RepID=A0A6J0JES9_RAPSA|nr:probable disease resistance protein At5g63020 [Raphanus sativus]KAJ4891396.1 Disease resistance protein (NBS-LRR class) family [Raphanus sativus]